MAKSFDGLTARVTLVYLIGFGSLAYGFYEFWRDDRVNQHAFLIGGTCVATAAAIQVFRDLWHRVRR